MGRPNKYIVTLDKSDRSSLQKLAKETKDQRLCIRARTLLLSDKGETQKNISLKLGISTTTVGKIIKLYCEKGKIEALNYGARDNFTQATKDVMAKRVACLCSNPDCRKSTFGPKSESSKSVTIGEAAHITAATFDGPRYDESITSEERKSVKNGIWLCRNCAGLIDKDPEKYSVGMLDNWKINAEQRAEINISSNRSQVEALDSQEGEIQNEVPILPTSHQENVVIALFPRGYVLCTESNYYMLFEYFEYESDKDIGTVKVDKPPKGKDLDEHLDDIDDRIRVLRIPFGDRAFGKRALTFLIGVFAGVYNIRLAEIETVNNNMLYYRFDEEVPIPQKPIQFQVEAKNGKLRDILYSLNELKSRYKLIDINGLVRESLTEALKIFGNEHPIYSEISLLKNKLSEIKETDLTNYFVNDFRNILEHSIQETKVD